MTLNLKHTSFLIKKDLKRFWPIWTCMLIVVFVGTIVRSVSDTAINTSVEGMIEYNLEYLSLSPVIAVLALVVVVNVFSFLTKERESYMIFSFPVSRKELFISHYISGIIMIYIPYILSFLYLYLYYSGRSVSTINEGFIYTVILIFEFYNIAVMCATLTGNGVSTSMIYAVIQMMFFVFLMIVDGINFHINVYANGFYNNFLENHKWVNYLLSPLTIQVFYSSSAEHTSSAVPYIFICLIPAVLSLIVAFFLFKKRPVESVEDMIVFEKTKPIYRVVFSVLGGLFFEYMYIMLVMQERQAETYKMTFVTTLIGTVLFTGILYFVSNMVIYRSGKIFKKTSKAGLLCVMLVSAAIIFLIRYIPQQDVSRDKIQSVIINVGNEYKSNVCVNLEINEEKEIDRIYELNKKILKYGNEEYDKSIKNKGNDDDPEMIIVDMEYIKDDLGDPDSIYPMYNYRLPADSNLGREYADMLMEYESKPEYIFGSGYADEIPGNIKVSVINESGDSYEEHQTEGESTDELYKALTDDINSGCFANITKNNGKKESKKSYNIQITYENNPDVDIIIDESFKETLNCIKRLYPEI